MKKGDSFTHTFDVTEEVYSRFQEIFCDRNPLHVDPEYAKEKGFDDRVMYGNILNGFISYFIGECLPQKNVVLISQSINYTKPVYLADSLEFNAEVKDVHESVRVVDFSYSFANAEGTRVARGKIQIRLL